MNIRELIPKHKDDQKVIERLKKLSFEEVKPIIPDLLEWLQDANWPIAAPIAEVLEPFGDLLASDILRILQTDDALWKLWALSALARNTKDQALLKEIERIANFPTRAEIEEGVCEEAAYILNGDIDSEG